MSNEYDRVDETKDGMRKTGWKKAERGCYLVLTPSQADTLRIMLKEFPDPLFRLESRYVDFMRLTELLDQAAPEPDCAYCEEVSAGLRAQAFERQREVDALTRTVQRLKNDNDRLRRLGRLTTDRLRAPVTEVPTREKADSGHLCEYCGCTGGHYLGCPETEL